MNWNWKANDSFKLFANVDTFLLEEIAGDESDPFMLILQPGFEWKPHNQMDYKF